MAMVRPGQPAQLDQLEQRDALQAFGRHALHLGKALLQQHDAAPGIEHAQALVHAWAGRVLRPAPFARLTKALAARALLRSQKLQLDAALKALKRH
jgi:hypothetical protein